MKPCNGCGKCCLSYGGQSGLGVASEADARRLINARRLDIIQWIDPNLGDLWTNPRTGEETSRCPWLRKLPGKLVYKCRIHAVRPDVCRNYPVSIEQMNLDGCEMLEESDKHEPDATLLQELQALRSGWSR